MEESDLLNKGYCHIRTTDIVHLNFSTDCTVQEQMFVKEWGQNIKGSSNEQMLCKIGSLVIKADQSQFSSEGDYSCGRNLQNFKIMCCYVWRTRLEGNLHQIYFPCVVVSQKILVVCINIPQQIHWHSLVEYSGTVRKKKVFFF